MKDSTACAIVTRDLPSHKWQLMSLTERVSVALESARLTEEQEHRMGNVKFEAKVMRLRDWDAKKIRARIKG